MSKLSTDIRTDQFALQPTSPRCTQSKGDCSLKISNIKISTHAIVFAMNVPSGYWLLNRASHLRAIVPAGPTITAMAYPRLTSDQIAIATQLAVIIEIHAIAALDEFSHVNRACGGEELGGINIAHPRPRCIAKSESPNSIVLRVIKSANCINPITLYPELETNIRKRTSANDENDVIDPQRPVLRDLLIPGKLILEDCTAARTTPRWLAAIPEGNSRRSADT